MVVVIVVAIAVAVVLAADASLRPSGKPVAAPVVAAAVVAEVVVAAPKGLSIKDRPPPAAEVVATEMLGAEAAPKVKPVLIAVVAAGGAAAVGTCAAKREGPEGGAAWVDAGGAGVDEGLIPKANPPP